MRKWCTLLQSLSDSEGASVKSAKDSQKDVIKDKNEHNQVESRLDKQSCVLDSKKVLNRSSTSFHCDSNLVKRTQAGLGGDDINFYFKNEHTVKKENSL